MRKEIAQFLQAGQEAMARIRVEHVTRKKNIWAAYEILELGGSKQIVAEATLPQAPTKQSSPLSPLSNGVHRTINMDSKQGSHHLQASGTVSNMPQRAAFAASAAGELVNVKFGSFRLGEGKS
ncbi:hypothetical protein POPTR_010G124100v4 [Populus trichocarpa]|uniref:Uncharacterized protein n=1 Tax=Populus trichocarpa TaxID=3694 RepID=A0ACC0SD34_POPTR|nr:hypothetical protein POPTR_010G124100v4 [Populus trichocarpa]